MTDSAALDEPHPDRGRNFDLKEEIRAYWAKRSETFDLSCGHKIRSEGELKAWIDLFSPHLRRGDRVLELASGTGEITRALLAAGCEVDAIDFCEPMLAQARAKLAGDRVRFHLGDAESTMMRDAAYEAVVCRHLVWTLIEPERAFADWLRVLKPGGALVIVDGDWVSTSWKSAVLGKLARLLDRLAGTPSVWDEQAHRAIVRQIRFSAGLRAPALLEKLASAGFSQAQMGTLARVKRHHSKSASWSERLRLLATYDHAFIVSAHKPLAPASTIGDRPS